MTPNDVKVVLYEVLGGGVFLSSYAFIIFVCGWLIAVALAAWAGAFFSKRGETAAMKHDLETIKDNLHQTTLVTEEIRARITGDLWVQQNRWTFRADTYRALLESVGDTSSALRQLMFIDESRPRYKDNPEIQKFLDDRENEYGPKAGAAFEKLVRTATVAGVWLDPRAIQALEDLKTAWITAHEGSPRATVFTAKCIRAAAKAIEALTEAAKDDLQLVRSTR